MTLAETPPLRAPGRRKAASAPAGEASPEATTPAQAPAVQVVIHRVDVHVEPPAPPPRRVAAPRVPYAETPLAAYARRLRETEEP